MFLAHGKEFLIPKLNLDQNPDSSLSKMVAGKEGQVVIVDQKPCNFELIVKAYTTGKVWHNTQKTNKARFAHAIMRRGLQSALSVQQLIPFERDATPSGTEPDSTNQCYSLNSVSYI